MTAQKTFVDGFPFRAWLATFTISFWVGPAGPAMLNWPVTIRYSLAPANSDHALCYLFIDVFRVRFVIPAAVVIVLSVNTRTSSVRTGYHYLLLKLS